MRRTVLRALAALAALALGFVLWVAARYRLAVPREDAGRVEAEIAALTPVRDSLRARLLSAADSSELFAHHPDGNILIGLPAPFVRALVRDVVTGWFAEIRLHLRDLDAHASGDVRAKLPILGTKRVGSYDVVVHVDTLAGTLKPGAPTLRFEHDVIRIALPVALTGGAGAATIRFDWDSHGAAQLVCGDLKATRAVHGTVKPANYVANGGMKLTVKDGAVIADPDFPALDIHLAFVPSASSVATLDSVLGQKGGLCGAAIRKAQVAEKILGLVGAGFDVKIPQKFFRPIRLPIAIRTAVPMDQDRLSLMVRPSGLTVSPDVVWVGASVGIRARDSAQTTHVDGRGRTGGLRAP